MVSTMPRRVTGTRVKKSSCCSAEVDSTSPFLPMRCWIKLESMLVSRCSLQQWKDVPVSMRSSPSV